ncbi:PREDICTED: serine/threonine-protein phosphatase 1 regulatory subunit 10-like [Amphimedon queenslandica]|uniref:Serine/threonine-protein phosphatase 1 regulatory subunit 10 n=1 Tax=Amphimedon queenslandica TaxID=400682 RepID=A0A1X7UVV1_AMPQE|nr:PREDICTED: serine/threonine-protein phosphatase 1 regulatory subunit 10-like [Amphimedon queenslandica]|eukprot:XP_019852044.1 PREDICTED: serine/threonine-protein phosphatase 1 regulatory subunit 10-like [Amphimedon queenslandica]
MAAESNYGGSAIQTIDPRARYTLDKLDSLVGSSGSLRSAQEVPKLISLMKETTESRHPLLLINRCLILNVLQATKAQSTLSKFMEGGGWSLLNVWLSDGKKSQNVAFLLEILQVLQKLPVSIVALKQGNLGKLVKQLSKHESPEVKSLANDILSKWMAVFREGQAARGKATPTGSKLEGGPSTGPTSSAQLDESTRVKEKEREERKAAKKLKKELQNAEAQGAVPLGPLVALGKPRDKLKKRPRDLSITKSVPEKKPKMSPSLSNAGDEEEKAQKTEKGLMESNIFMDTLSSQAAAKWQEKRIKKLNKSGPKPSPTQTKAPSDIETPPTSADPLHPLTNGLDATNGDEGENEVDKMETSDSESKKPKKKKVSWADDKNLVSIHYFEMDESERTNVSFGKSFLDAAQREKLMEKEALSSIAYNQLVEVMQWYRPFLIDCIELAQRGKDSNEKLVQAQREETVLAQLFLSKSSVLPTPTEPDPVPENDEGMEEKVRAIPLLEPGAPAAPSLPPFSGPPYGPVGDQRLFNDHQSYNQEPQNHSPHYYQGGSPGAFPPGDPNFRGPPDPMGQNYPAPHYGYPPHPSSMDYQYYPDTNGGGGAHHSTRGRGRGRNRFSKGNICKHFISHGCRLGSNCRFLHIGPEELKNSPETDGEARLTGDLGKEREREERVVSPDQRT